MVFYRSGTLRKRRELTAVTESVERSASGVKACTLTAGRLISLPNRGPARLVAVTTDAPPSILEIRRPLQLRHSGPAGAERPFPAASDAVPISHPLEEETPRDRYWPDSVRGRSNRAHAQRTPAGRRAASPDRVVPTRVAGTTGNPSYRRS